MAERGAGGQQHLEDADTEAAEEGGGRDERCGAGGSGGEGQGLGRERAAGGGDEKGGKAAEVTDRARHSAGRIIEILLQRCSDVDESITPLIHDIASLL